MKIESTREEWRKGVRRGFIQMFEGLPFPSHYIGPENAAVIKPKAQVERLGSEAMTPLPL